MGAYMPLTAGRDADNSGTRYFWPSPRRRLRLLGCFVVLASGLGAAAGAEQTVDFDRDIRPILSNRCFTCHGPDDGSRVTALRFDTEAGVSAVLSSGGQAIIGGQPEHSEMLARITSDDPVRRMPPSYRGLDKLPQAEIDLLRLWIVQGSPWSTHWSFSPPSRPTPTSVGDNSLSGNPIDALVLAKLRAEGLQPNPRASREALVRRLSLDLTGLPPSLEELDRFLGDESDEAYESLVDRLLASPSYGERMTTPWLDAARYADTNGYQSDGPRDMWAWRDWVVKAFNDNMAFDDFTIAQIAGDLLPNASEQDVIATGFNRNQRTNAEGGIVEEEFLAEYAADRASTTSTVWLGLTIGCARCHDHKYDPLTQKEFYQFYAYFNNVPERGLVYNFGNDGATIQAPTASQRSALAELKEEVRRAEQQLKDVEPTIVDGIKVWAAKLAHSKRPDWESSDGLLAHHSFSKRAVEYANWKSQPEGRPERGPAKIVRTEGKLGTAAELKEGDVVDLGDAAGFSYDDAFTFSFWIYPEQADGAILTRTEDVSRESGYGLYLVGGRLRFEFTLRYTDLSMRVVSNEPLELGRWQHVTLSYSGERPAAAGTTIYVDGQAAPFDVEWDDLKWPIEYNQPLRLGAGGGRPSFVGRLDELRVYDRAVSAADAAILSLDKSLAEIAAMDVNERSASQTAKLRRSYLELAAPREVQFATTTLKMAEQRRDAFEATIPSVMVMAENADRRPAFVLQRGAYDQPGDAVAPGIPQAISSSTANWEQSRLGLARWLVDRSNPLTARVTVNRLWEMLFGIGLVKTTDNFGTQGERPLHRELLDWLAVEFMESGWDVKHIVKTMVTSEAYRRSSATTPELIQSDPENRLLARGPRFRLPAEMIRDQALIVSGLLNGSIGGPPVKPYQPAGLWEEVSGAAYRQDSGDALYRKSLYTYWKRTVPPPSMIAFDAPDRESCEVSRPRTNTPIQALTLMNDVTYLEASRELAQRMMTEGGSEPAARLSFGFRLLTSRFPEPAELEVLSRTRQNYIERYQKDKSAATAYVHAGQTSPNRELDARELAAYMAVASILLNLDETVTRQ
jgi:hypothetical protein